MSAPDVVLAANAALGEGAIWDRRSETLLWVDILEHRVGRFDPSAGKNRSLQLPSPVGTVVPTSGSDLLVAVQNGVGQLDPLSGRLSAVTTPRDHDGSVLRFNDGKCDPAGRFWAGTMSLDGQPGRGSLYCFESGRAPRRVLSGISISNGLAWSLDHRRFYYIDTPTRTVMAFDYDLGDGTILNPRAAIQIPSALGWPDGMTIDADGMLWIALWDGGAVTRWDPASGTLLGHFPVPASRPTSCAFGGPNLATLFVTSARTGLSAEVLAREPHAGSIFALNSAVAGIEANRFQGGARPPGAPAPTASGSV